MSVRPAQGDSSARLGQSLALLSPVDQGQRARGAPDASRSALWHLGIAVAFAAARNLRADRLTGEVVYPGRPALGAQALRNVLVEIFVGLLLASVLQGCAISVAEQDAIRSAWEIRDTERARECVRAGGGFVAGGCVRGGP